MTEAQRRQDSMALESADVPSQMMIRHPVLSLSPGNASKSLVLDRTMMLMVRFGRGDESRARKIADPVPPVAPKSA